MSIKLVLLVVAVSFSSAVLTTVLLVNSMQTAPVASQEVAIKKTSPVLPEIVDLSASQGDLPRELDNTDEVFEIADDLVKSGSAIEGLSPEHQALVTKLDSLYAEYDTLASSNQNIPVELKTNIENTKSDLLEFVNNMEVVDETL